MREGEPKEDIDFEKALNPEKMEISGGKLLELFESGNFLEALDVAATETQKSELETGFMLKVLQDGSPYIFGVIKGNESSANVYGYSYDSESTIKEIDGREKEAERKASLMTLHFHPSGMGPIIPSIPDLHQVESVAPGLSFPFMAVGHAREAGNVDLLLVRRDKNYKAKEVLGDSENYHNQIKEMGFIPGEDNIGKSQEDIQKALSDNGFESFLVSFGREGEELKMGKKSEKIVAGIKGVEAPILKW